MKEQYNERKEVQLSVLSHFYLGSFVSRLAKCMGIYMRNLIIKMRNAEISEKFCVYIILLLAVFFLSLNVLYADTLQDKDVKYLISVNRVRNNITIYQGNEAGEYRVAVKSMVCSTAADGVSTPVGTFTLKDRRDWGVLTDGVYSPYITRIEGSVLFVGSAYYSVDSSDLDVQTYNRLGEAATGNGCIRLTDADAKWIYDNCPAGTPVEIFDDMETMGPLGEPDAIKIPIDHEFSGWDPTNPDEENPWKELNPRIEGTRDLELEAGETVDLFDGVKAYDTCGNDISSRIVLMGEYDFDNPGTYVVTYLIEDDIKAQADVDITVTVSGKGAITETTDREPVTIATQKDVKAKEKKSKVVSVLALGFVTLALAVLLLKWAKRD